MDKTNVCPIEITVSLISDKWIILIIRELLTGTKRFNELKKSIGSVTQKVLTQSLRKMETNGLIDRKIYNEIPPKVEYSLTKIGLSLKPILDTMKDWGQNYLEKNK